MIERTSPKTKSSKLSSPDIITIKIIPEKMGEKSKQDDDTIQLVISRKSQPISETKSTKPSSLKTSIIKSKQSTDPIELPGKLNDFKIEVKTTVELMKDGKLLISNAGHRDIGSYQCHVEGLTSRSARLRFYQGRAKPTILHR